MTRNCFSVWCLENSQKLLTTNQFLVTTILFTNINIPFFNLGFDRFSIIAKKVHQIRKNVVCDVARLVFVFHCALITGRCNAFQHIFVTLKKWEFYGPYFQTMLFLVTIKQQRKRKIWVRKLVTERRTKGKFNILEQDLMLFDHFYFF